jgi:hypothetical protein
VSSATTQTSPRTPRSESDININYDLESDSVVQNGSFENHIGNSNTNEKDNDACQNISESVLRIVTSATVDNVFDVFIDDRLIGRATSWSMFVQPFRPGCGDKRLVDRVDSLIGIKGDSPSSTTSTCPLGILVSDFKILFLNLNLVQNVL